LQIASDQEKAAAAVQEFIAANGKDNPYNVAELYGLRKQPDPMFEWLQKARTQHDPQLILNLLSDPFVLPYQHDPRFAALCKQLGLPLPGQVLPAAAGSASRDASPANTDAAASGLGGVQERHYDRADYLPQTRAALETLHRLLIDNSAPNVPMRRKNTA
jgi:hypothetical protein